MGLQVSRITAQVVMIVLITVGLVFAQGKVDINTADVKQLMSLKGVGEQKAKAIIQYRQMNGLFHTLDDLQNVSGIGEKTIADNKDKIIMSQGASGKKSVVEKMETGRTDTTDKAKEVKPAKK
jgi:competence protein ComEA